MITDWQGVWGYGVPFVVIQLHTWGYMPCDEETVLANELEAGIRLAQWDVRRHNISHTTLVSAVDLGGALHPPYKGRRVALATIGTVFFQDIKWQYPYIRNAPVTILKASMRWTCTWKMAKVSIRWKHPRVISQIHRNVPFTAARMGHLACSSCWATIGDHSIPLTNTTYSWSTSKKIMFISPCWPTTLTRESLIWLEFSIKCLPIHSVLL